MARTDAATVGEIIKIKTGDDVTPFITAANELVTECCTGDAVETEYDASRLVLIETWLAAHFYRQYREQIETEKAGEVSRKFATKVDLGFDNNYYGQQAMRLDTQGGLASLNKQIKDGIRKVATVTWLGTENTAEVIDY